MFGLRFLPAVGAGVFLMCAWSATAQIPDDQTQIRQAMQDFWSAYSARNLDGILAVWDPQSSEFIESRETLRIHFASYRLAVESIGIPEITLHGDSAHAVVAARITATDNVTGLPPADGFRSPKRVFDLKKVAGAWKIENFAQPERPLADALIKATPPAERASLLEASPDLVNSDLVFILARIARRTSSHGENDRGLQIAEIVLDIARRLEDPHALTMAWIVQGQIYFNEGDYEKAKARYESALQSALEGKSRLDEALARRSVGWMLTQTNEPRKAVSELENAVSLAHGLDRYTESDALDALGEAYRQAGKLDQALVAFHSALQIGTESGERDGVSVADTNIANVLYMKGEYTQALKYLEDARAISHELNDPGGEGSILNTIGVTYDATGHYREALQAYQESKALRKAADDPVGMIFSDCNIAIVLMETGKTADAVSAFDDCYTRAHEKGIKSLESDSMSNLASLYIHTGRYGLALEKLNIALERDKEMQDPISLAQTTANVATIYEKTGRTNNALAEFQKINKQFQSSGVKDEQARTLGSLAAIHMQRKDFRQAEQELLDSLKLRTEITDSEGIVDAQSSLADLYREWGKEDQAIERGLLAVKAVAAIENPAYQGQAHLALGRAIARKDPPKSREEFEMARERAESVSAIEVLIESDTGLGELDIAAQKWNEADAHCRAAMEEAEEVRTGSIDPILKLGVQEMKSRALGCRITALLALKRNEEAFEVAEAAKARTLEETIGTQRFALAKVPANKLEELNEQDEKARDLSNKLLTGVPSRDIYKELLAAERDADTKRRELYVTYAPQASSGPPGKPISIGDAGLLFPDPGSAFLEYVVSESAVFLFVIRRPAAAAAPELSVRRIRLSRDLLRIQARNLRAGILSHGITVPEQNLLFNELIVPAKPLLDGVTTIGIVPDAELWEIPFAVLNDESGRPVMESWASFYAPSLSFLRDTERLADRRPSAKQGSLLLIGNPYLGPGGSLNIPYRGSFKNLVNAEREVNEVADVARGYGVRTTKKIGVEATERFVKDEWGKSLYVHMALHGYSDRGDALSSFLLLAQDQQDKTEDGLLEAREILEQNLNANLVVLSACDSARGEVLSGELPLGLAWTMFAAGASSTVVTQWSIDDPTTAELMKKFYELWAFGLGGAKGVSKARSLQLAQQEMLKSGSSLDPALWGAFVLIGDPR
jgi:CHAT domain-containing protein/Tfp pilus assembly protein PilF